MKSISVPVVLLSLLALGLAAAPASADPEGCTILEFSDVGNLLTLARQPASSTMSLLPSLQDEGWGWGEEPKKEDEKKPEDEPKKEEGSGDSGGWGEEPKKEDPKKEEPKKEEPKKGDSGDWGGGWGEGEGGEGGEGEGEGTEGPAKPGPGPVEREDEPTPSGPPTIEAAKLRIGLEGGIFVPLGAKEETYEQGTFGGLFVGFGLPPLLGDMTISMELRLIGASTKSEDQEKGFDMSTTLLGGRADFLLHLMPTNKTLNAFFFIGVGFGIEMSKGQGTDPYSGDVTEESATYAGFLADFGLGVWLHLFGPLDLFIRLEGDFLPLTSNVPFFGVGEGGLQLRF